MLMARSTRTAPAPLALYTAGKNVGGNSRRHKIVVGRTIMSNVPGQYTPDEINQVFAHLQPHDVEQFYVVYQQWLRQSTIANLQAQIESLRNQIAENDLRIQQVQPSSIALSIIARLQYK